MAVGSNQTTADALRLAYDAAMAFPVEQVNALRATPEQLMDQASQEAAFGRISVNDQGLTAGSRLHVIEPARAVLASWRQTRRPFDVAIEPKMRAIRAVQDVENEIAAARDRAARDERDADTRLEGDEHYRRVRQTFHTAETRYHRIKADHENRDANMAAYHPAYWAALLCIGVAEWLINYDVFFLFAGSPRSPPARPSSWACCWPSRRTATARCSSSGHTGSASIATRSTAAATGACWHCRPSRC